MTTGSRTRGAKGAAEAPTNIADRRFDAPPRDDTMDGFDGGQQAEAFPGNKPPPGSIIPPTAAVMENVTYLDAGPELYLIVESLVQGQDEFKELRGRAYEVVWARNQSKSLAGEPLHAWATFPGLLEAHLAQRIEAALPEFVVVLSYRSVDKLRAEGGFLHPDVLGRHVHIALMTIAVSEGGVLSKQQPTVQVFPETVAKYGTGHFSGLRPLQRAMALWPEAGE